jgi:3-phosphoshikimate 1-carboxyvinyltransferase
MEIYHIKPSTLLPSEIGVPGDKSISHRAVMLGAIAEGDTLITNYLAGEDCLATINAMRAMGVVIEGPNNGQVVVYGAGKYGLKDPTAVLNVGNSGTSMRVLSGLLAGHGVTAILEGDSSLMQRPMKRVVEPLTYMGADITCEASGKPPLVIRRPKQRLTGMDFQSAIASAQVKSAILLAGLYAEGQTSVIEAAPTRDHTERMLRAFNYPVEQEGNIVKITGGGRLTATEITVPGDISSAAFFMVAAAMTPGAELMIYDIGVNPTRIGVLNILRLMGARITLENKRMFGNEPVADIHIRGTQLQGITIPPEQVPLAIDEFPAILIAAAYAKGMTKLSGAAELRVKESDRIQAMADGLKAVGIQCETTTDGILVHGGTVQGGIVNSHGDHRIAMAFAIAGWGAQGPIEILNCRNVATSFPDFIETAQGCGLAISSEIRMEADSLH